MGTAGECQLCVLDRGDHVSFLFATPTPTRTSTFLTLGVSCSHQTRHRLAGCYRGALTASPRISLARWDRRAENRSVLFMVSLCLSGDIGLCLRSGRVVTAWGELLVPGGWELGCCQAPSRAQDSRGLGSPPQVSACRGEAPWARLQVRAFAEEPGLRVSLRSAAGMAAVPGHPALPSL